jgi:hypothetical protein
MEKLKSCIQTYRKLDDDLKDTNMKVQELRREKKTIETEMATILAQPEFQQYDKLEIKEDGSMIKIQRPGAWTKAWSLSKKDLFDSLTEYFETHNGTSDDALECYESILDDQKEKMVTKEFNFDRTKKRQVDSEFHPPSKKIA